MDQFTDVLAILGIYAALMAVLALCVEAVIGWLKLPMKWLQGQASPNQILEELSQWMPKDEAERKIAKVNALKETLASLPGISPEDESEPEPDLELAKKAMREYGRAERERIAFVRLYAIILGFGFAVIFQANTVELLSPIFPAASSLWVGGTAGFWPQLLGFLLSGVAASAGSGFWHDTSGRLRSLKATAEQAKKVAASN